MNNLRYPSSRYWTLLGEFFSDGIFHPDGIALRAENWWRIPGLRPDKIERSDTTCDAIYADGRIIGFAFAGPAFSPEARGIPRELQANPRAVAF